MDSFDDDVAAVMGQPFFSCSLVRYHDQDQTKMTKTQLIRTIKLNSDALSVAFSVEANYVFPWTNGLIENIR